MEETKGAKPMRQHLKRRLVLLFVLACAMALLCSSAMAADVVDSGTCGVNLTWVLDSEGTLTISGSGPMTDYYSFNYDLGYMPDSTEQKPAPWASHLNSVKTVDIQSGVTSIGNDAFYSCKNLSRIDIPDDVTRIGNGAFYGCSSLNSITLPNYITSIGMSSFSSCIKLKNLTLPDSVNSIGKGAFSGCYSLTDINIPYSITDIGAYTFSDCRQLTDITIPANVTRIGDGAFYGCLSLNSITIPDGVESIGVGAFEECTGLTSVIIPDSVTEIGDNAFLYCDKLSDVTLHRAYPNLESIFRDTPWWMEHAPRSGTYGDNLTWLLDDEGTLTISGSGDMDASIPIPWNPFRNSIQKVVIASGVTSIGRSTFSDCSSLKSVTIPNTVTSLGESAFSRCSSLKSVTIPNTVTSLGEYAFYYCSGLESITLPDGLTTIEEDAFSNCESLQTIAIPNSVTSIGDYAFGWCSSLTQVTLSEDYYNLEKAFICTPWLENNPPRLGTVREYDEDTGELKTDLTWKLDDSNTLTIQGTGEISSDTQWRGYAYSIKKAILKPGVTGIGPYVFSNYEKMTAISIPDTVTHIDEYAFNDCRCLNNVSIPASVTQIGDFAFIDCSSLSNVTLNNTYSNLVRSFFTTPWWTATHPNEGLCGENLTWKLDDSGTLTITGAGSMYYDTYDKLSHIRSKIRHVVIPSGATQIASRAFDGFPNLTDATISGKNLVIEEYAFCSCPKLTSVTLQAGVKKIGRVAFWMCPKLTKVTMADSVTSIGESAFMECKKLSTVTLSKNLTSIGSSAFYGCESLSSITLPKGITKIQNYSFSDCRSLSSVAIPNTVTSIGKFAFHDCEKLASLSIPNTVTSIGSYAFRRSGLTKVVIPGSVTAIGDYAFADSAKLATVTTSKNYTNKRLVFYDTPWWLANAPRTGTCGSDARWTLDDATGTLTFSGTGTAKKNVNIDDLRSLIKKIVIKSGITGISGTGDPFFGLFAGYEKVTYITVPGGIKRADFSGCNHIKTLRFTGDAPTSFDFSYDNYVVENSVTAYYPAGNKTWTAAKKKAIGNDIIKWVGVQTITAKSYTKTLDAKAFSLNAKTSGDGTLTYKSDKTAVATVSKAGKVTPKGVGKATITITASKTATCAAASKKITITVKKGKLSGCTATLSATSYTYSGTVKKPGVTVKNGSGTTLIKGTDYTVAYKNNKAAGTATVTVTGKGNYSGTVTKKFTIKKAANPLTAKGKKATVKYSALKRKKQTVAATKAVTVTKAQGKVTYAKSGGNAKITVAKTGAVTVKKGLKKGTYKVKVAVKAAGNANYKAGTKTVTVTITVK